MNRNNIEDKLDKTRLNALTRELIRRRFITSSDFDLYRYDALFNNLLKQYDYKVVLIATSYTVSKMKDRGDIIHQFAYFKVSILNSIHKLTTPVYIDWFNNID